MPEKKQTLSTGCEEGIHYSIRESRRAKHVRLRVSAHEGLVVVVPGGFDVRQVSGIVRERLHWVQRAFAKIPPVADRNAGLPDTLSLRSIGEEWSVVSCRNKDRRNFLTESSGRILSIHTVADDPAVQCDLLRKWVRRKASIELLPWLEETAKRYGFSYNRAMVRHQKTRWGSFSTKGTISLNMKLLFLPSELVDYIMLHELCHSIHMNHSRRFWALVERHMPDYRARDRAMRNTLHYIPQFVAA